MTAATARDAARIAPAITCRRRLCLCARSAIARAKSSSSAVSAPAYRSRHSSYSWNDVPVHSRSLVRPFSSHRCAACFSWSRRPRPPRPAPASARAAATPSAATRARSRPGGGSAAPPRPPPRSSSAAARRPARRSTSSAAFRSGKSDSSSSRSTTARVPCAVTRLRKISRTIALPLGADPVQRRLGVLGQRARDAADLLVRRPRQQLPLAVPLLPETRHREGQQRQRRPRPLHRLHHLVDEGLVLEAVAALPSPARRAPAAGPRALSAGSGRERLEHRRERLVLRAAASGSRRAATAARARPPRAASRPSSAAKRSCASVGFSVNSSSNWSTTRSASPWPFRHRLDQVEGRPPGRRSPTSRSQRLGVPGQLRRERLPQAPEGRRPRRATRAPPSPRGRDATTPARTNDVLPAPEGPITAEQLPRPQPLPERLDLRLPPEEDGRVLLREAREPRVRAPLLHLLQARRPRRRRQHRLQRQRQVVRRAEPLLPLLLQAPPHDPAAAPAGRPAPATTAPPASPPGSPSASPTVVSRRNGCFPRQQLVQHHPEREDVRPVVHRQPPHLLRRHVPDRPQQLPRPRRRRLRRLRARRSPAGPRASPGRSPAPSPARPSSRTRSRA